MPQIVQSTIKTRNLSISGIFVDLLQLVAMNEWLFHYLIGTFKHEKRKQAKFWIHPKRPCNHESDMRPLSSSKLRGDPEMHGADSRSNTIHTTSEYGSEPQTPRLKRKTEASRSSPTH
ncbi:hypothetical protein DERF_005168 [Dermatophagoides farinae]|uniref:Uncharacterized protein n=1 Tax=Dermatophagoides farinae TaxID=6954 RepID=A0A922L8E9_DERFA|nr:hypothetical protein DERF_005168 [Dermatophagoides farinae]